MEGKTSEHRLQLNLIENPVKPFTKLVAWEWFVGEGLSHLGKEDLVFQNPERQSCLLVTETKYLGACRSGKRTKVKEQAFKYAKAWKKYPGSFVQTATSTTSKLLRIIDHEEH